LDAFLETLKNIGPARLALMLVTLFGLFIFFVFIAIRSSTPSMTMLFGDLSTSDSTEIAAKLDLSNIPFKLSADAKQVMVPNQDVGRARMLLAQDGLPSNGSIGYEIFDKKQSFGTTNFVQNINQLRALEGELARTISTLDPIRTARVHIVLPQRELFSRESRAATASVFLNIRNQAQMGPEQILAVRHLVASAVPQLKPTRVAIVDSNGTLLARTDDTEGGSNFSPQTSDDLRRKYEQRLTRAVEDLVSRIVGHGKVRANVTADLNFDIITRNSEIFDPEGQVVRSTQSINEEENDTTGSQSGAVTVQNNLPGLPNQGSSESTSQGIKNTRSEEVVNFEVTKTIESIVSESGQVQKLSVAVLVDGKYLTPTASTDETSDETSEQAKPQMKYIPRSQEELDLITRLVKSAIGYDEMRGDSLEVINLQFAKVEVFDTMPEEDMIFGFLKEDIKDMSETLILSIVAILVILLVLRPLVSHIASSAAATVQNASNASEEFAMLPPGMEGAHQLAPPGSDEAEMLAGAGGAQSELDATLDMSQVEGRVKASSIKKISEMVDSHPNETVSVIRTWMSQEG